MRRRVYRDWFDEHNDVIEELKNERNLMFLNSLDNDDPAVRARLVELGGRVQINVRNMENTWWINIAREMQNSTDRGDQQITNRSLSA